MASGNPFPALDRVIGPLLAFLPALATGLVAIGGVLTAVVAAGGGFDRLARNALDDIDRALFLLQLGVGAAFLGIVVLLIWKSRGERVAALCTAIATVLFTLALFEFVGAATKSAALSEQVRLGATVSLDQGQARISGAVTRTGTKVGEVVVVEIWARRTDGKYDGTPIWYATSGPSADGTIEIPLDVTISATRYDRVIIRAFGRQNVGDELPGFNECDLTNRPTTPTAPVPSSNAPETVPVPDAGVAGCLAIPVPVFATAPRLTASATGTGDDRVVTVHVESAGLTAEDRVQLSVFGLAADSDPQLLHDSLIAADPDGTLAFEQVLPVGNGLNWVCATVGEVTVRARPSASPTASPSAAPSSPNPEDSFGPPGARHCPIRGVLPYPPTSWVLVRATDPTED